MDEATGILAFIGGGFVGLVVLIIVLAKVLSSPRAARFAGPEAGSGVYERIDTTTDFSTAYTELESFVPDSTDDSSGSDDGGSGSGGDGGGDD